MMLYICTKFHENISKGVRVIEQTPKQKFTKGHTLSIENVGGVAVLVLCISFDDSLYFYQVWRKYLKGFLRVTKRTQSHDGQMDRQTDKVITIGPPPTLSDRALITSPQTEVGRFFQRSVLLFLPFSTVISWQTLVSCP